MSVKLTFWLAVMQPLYTYFGYPLVLLFLRLIIHREVRKSPLEPKVSLLIPAYNESHVIRKKILNALACDYPADLLEIVVASDGSNDGTAELAKQVADGTSVRVLDYKVNRGKILTINSVVPELRGEIIVFSDASAMLCPNALRQLMSNFADPEVGAVSGRFIVMKPDEVATGRSEDFYWKYETYLKVQESELASTLGGHGSLYAIRKELYSYPAEGTINDDYVIPLSVLNKGFRAVYEPLAIVSEEACEMEGFGRRVRIMTGNLQQLQYLHWLISPLRPLPFFFFLSHKVSRLLVPFSMIGAFLANVFLLNHSLYSCLFGLQILFYLLAIVGSLYKVKHKVLLLPSYFSIINLATLFGIYHVLTQKRRMNWK